MSSLHGRYESRIVARAAAAFTKQGKNNAGVSRRGNKKAVTEIGTGGLPSKSNNNKQTNKQSQKNPALSSASGTCDDVFHRGRRIRTACDESDPRGLPWRRLDATDCEARRLPLARLLRDRAADGAGPGFGPRRRDWRKLRTRSSAITTVARGSAWPAIRLLCGVFWGGRARGWGVCVPRFPAAVRRSARRGCGVCAVTAVAGRPACGAAAVDRPFRRRFRRETELVNVCWT